ncbi:bifunctional diguanylate cyclase/phosphodiesterase [Salaquimonas pukyongi]|uniref:bifunctional diguanylate cyclase/phosphodiesterase n=1 Tax=Salaquimonas pukyongi TaxID=2712698 RepID=UPI00096BA2A9|nr:diguanylate cyclase [Salaquimonas pukyongi]
MPSNKAATAPEHSKQQTVQSGLSAKGISSALAKLHEAAETIVAATGQAFYVWDIRSDRIEWSRNFSGLLGLPETETRHLKGRSFESMLSSQSQQTRFGVIVSAAGTGKNDGPVPYQCVYLLHPATKEDTPLWIEDTGCWYPDGNGKPRHAEGSIRIINDRRKREEDLRRQTDFDDLTCLPNRRSLEKCLVTTIRDAQNRGSISTFLIMSLDHMDTINDVHGFETGDEVLREAGKRVASRLRGDDVVCRFSGAKFGLILRDCPPAEVFDAATRLLKAVSAEPLETAAGPISINSVIGACFLPRHGNTPREVIGNAYKALRTVRSDVAHRVNVYSADPLKLEENRRKARLSAKVLAAIREDTVETCLKDAGVTFGGERLFELKMGFATSGKEDAGSDAERSFFDLGRELDLTRHIDLKALDTVLAALEQPGSDVYLLNVSRDTILDSDWMAKLSTGLAATGNAAPRLVVGISEAFALSGKPEAVSFLKSVASLGCRIRINRFSASPAAFDRLRSVPADIVMLDETVLNWAENGPPDNDCLKHVEALASAMNLEVHLPA